ncbi:MAG: ShlB/FhaC/HecB family hemolysin secretion/activation protein [Arenicellales bacterium]
MISKNFVLLALGVGAFALSSIGLAQTNSETSAAPKMSTADDAALLQYRLENEGDVLAVVQAREDGQLDVLHGQITDVLITGASVKVEKEIRRLLAPLLDLQVPLLSDVEYHLSLVTDLHGVSTQFALHRIETPGDYALEVAVFEQRGSGLIAMDTVPRAGFDQLRGTFHQEFYSLFEGGDVLRLNAAYTQGEASNEDGLAFFGSYQTFMGSDGAFLEAAIGNSSARIDSLILGAQDTGYETNSLSLMFGKDLTRSQTGSKVIYAEGTLIDDKNADQGDSLLSILRGSFFQRIDATDGSRTSFGLTGSFGIDDNALTNTNETFTSVRAGFGHIVPTPRILKSSELLIELFGQLGEKNSPAAELFYLGSSQFLRGFNRGQYAGNSGATLSLEFGWLASVADQTLRPFLFLDSGYVQNDDNARTSDLRPESNLIASSGLGVDLYIKDTLASLRGWIGAPIYDQEFDKDDPFIYIQFQVGW